MIVADGYAYDGRQAYLLSYYSNSVIWLDSVMITGNHAKFQAKLPYKEMLCEVIVADCPTSFQQFRFRQGEKASFVFNPNIGTLYPPVEGSPASEEAVTYWSDISSYFKKQRELRKELMITDLSEDRSDKIKRQIESVSDDIRLRSFELLSETKSLINAYLAYAVLEDRLPKDSLATIKQQLLKRWPDDIYRSLLTRICVITGDSIGDMPLRSKIVLNRRAVLLGDLPPYSVEEYPETNETESETESYSIDDVVADFSLPNGMDNTVALSSLITPYVLVDFWASWCGPCREEIPALLSAVRDYKGTLSVYAVSIDENLNRWKHAVEADGSGTALTHVILRKNNADYDRLFRLFGIETIPHNFLLDADRRIVAIDLRGEALRTKMEELQRK